MKEITRIHLAKVAYDIEIDAKREIEKYIKELEIYAGEPELMNDIEIRMTELLAERGVMSGGVIAKADVEAVRQRLGEPSDFAPEGASQPAETIMPDEPRKRLYRDTDDAVVSGVLSGIARYFGFDPIWVRLVFILLLFVSHGALLIPYLIAWLIIPPARTAAEKLRMSGKPVTLESIKKFGEQAQPTTSHSASILKNILAIGLGILLLLTGIGVLIATTVIGFGLPFGTTGVSLITNYIPDSPWLWTALALMVVAGLSFSALCFVLANSVFRRTWDKRTTTIVAVIVAVGLVSAIGGAALGSVGYYNERESINNSRRTSSVNLPANFKSVTSFTIKNGDDFASNAHVEYIVSDKARWEIDTLPCLVKPTFEIANDSKAATMTLAAEDCGTDNNQSRWINLVDPVIRIYGPALTELNLEENTNVRYYNSNKQNELKVVSKSAKFELSGSYDAVTISMDDSSVELEGAAITALSIDNNRGDVTAGVVRSLNVTQPDSCAIDSSRGANASIEVQAVSSGKITYNGNERVAKDIENVCGEITIESEGK